MRHLRGTFPKSSRLCPQNQISGTDRRCTQDRSYFKHHMCAVRSAYSDCPLELCVSTANRNFDSERLQASYRPLVVELTSHHFAERRRIVSFSVRSLPQLPCKLEFHTTSTRTRVSNLLVVPVGVSVRLLGSPAELLHAYHYGSTPHKHQNPD